MCKKVIQDPTIKKYTESKKSYRIKEIIRNQKNKLEKNSRKI